MKLKRLMLTTVLSLIALSLFVFTVEAETWNEVESWNFNIASEKILLDYNIYDYPGHSIQLKDLHPSDGSYNSAISQSFVPSESAILVEAVFCSLRIGSPSGILYAKLYAESGGKPSGSALAVSDGLDISTITLYDSWYTMNFTDGYEVEGGVTYCITFGFVTSGVLDSSNYLSLAYEYDDPQHDGSLSKYGSGVWYSQVGDLYFYVYGVPTSPSEWHHVETWSFNLQTGISKEWRFVEAWTFNLTTLAEVETIMITLQTNPSGLNVRLDGGVWYSSPHNYEVISGTIHSIECNSPQSAGSGIRYVWTSWSDAGANPHNVAPTVNTIYTATYKTQYYFAVFSAYNEPTGQAWYDSGSGPIYSTVTTPSGGYQTTGWTGTGSLSSGGTIRSNRTSDFWITEYTTCTWNWEPASEPTWNHVETWSFNLQTPKFNSWRINASYDDCKKYNGSGIWQFDKTGTYLMAGYVSSTLLQYGSGMRWTGINIPKGSTIESAYLNFTARTSDSGTVVRTKIKGENSDNASTFSDLADFNNRERTQSLINWEIPPWSTEYIYTSPDISSIIQEIIDREGWQNGNALVLFWEDFDDLSDHNSNCRRECYSYDDNPEKSVLLYIKWSGVPPSEWHHVETWSFNLQTGISKEWRFVESWSFNFNSTIFWREVESWSFNLDSKQMETILVYFNIKMQGELWNQNDKLIIIDGSQYGTNTSKSFVTGNHTLAFWEGYYQFVNWTGTEGIVILDCNKTSTTLMLSGDGTLTLFIEPGYSWYLENIPMWMGIAGIALIVLSPMFIVYFIKDKEYEIGMIIALMGFALGFAMIVAWLWA